MRATKWFFKRKRCCALFGWQGESASEVVGEGKRAGEQEEKRLQMNNLYRILGIICRGDDVRLGCDSKQTRGHTHSIRGTGEANGGEGGHYYHRSTTRAESGECVYSAYQCYFLVCIVVLQ